MTNPKPLSEQERADLVAYLDGEMEEEAARTMEAKIDSDPAVRAEADALKRTWELLDYLPSQDPSPSFTHRTVERVSALRSKQDPVAMPGSPLGRWKPYALGLGWAAAVLLAGGIGFAVTTRVLPREPSDEELSRDLRVIENRKAYEQADDLDFLKQLDQPDLFGDDPDS
jgi:anti-sigma factor RsiW